MDASVVKESGNPFIGCQVSLSLKENKGTFQGKVVNVDSVTQGLTLANLIHNGHPTGLQLMSFR